MTPWPRVLTYTLLSPAANLPGRAYASNGEALYVTENGQAWREVRAPLSPSPLSYVAVNPADPARVYVAECCNGPFFRSSDGGATWTKIDTGTNGIFVHPDDPAHLYTLSGGRGIQESSDHGVTWRDLGDWRTQAGTGGSNFVSSFAFSPDGPRTLYIGAGGFDFFNGSDPASWGHVFVSRDGGAAWSRTSFGQANWAILGIAAKPGDPNTLVVATSNVGIYRTTNGGATWDLVSEETSFGGRHRLSPRMQADPGEPGLIVAALSQVVVSEDFGATWQRRSPVNGPPSVLLVRRPEGGLRIVVPSGQSDGALYFSDDLGRRWERVETGVGDAIQMVAAARDGTLYAVTTYAGRGSGPAAVERQPSMRPGYLVVPSGGQLRPLRWITDRHSCLGTGLPVAGRAGRDDRRPPRPRATYGDFASWCGRMRGLFKLKEPHKIYEEIKGVITGTPVSRSPEFEHLAVFQQALAQRGIGHFLDREATVDGHRRGRRGRLGENHEDRLHPDRAEGDV